MLFYYIPHSDLKIINYLEKMSFNPPPNNSKRYFKTQKLKNPPTIKKKFFPIYAKTSKMPPFNKKYKKRLENYINN